MNTETKTKKHWFDQLYDRAKNLLSETKPQTETTQPNNQVVPSEFSDPTPGAHQDFEFE